MTATDTVFAGSIPALYERYMVPMLFTPYAEDLAARAAATGARHILETAAGTGVVTEAMLAAMPEAEIIATDLNQAMLDVAGARIESPRATFQAADAQALPFPDGAFDALVCQFGVMFFPDRVGAYREAHRILKPGGTFLFNAWGRVEENGLTAALADAVREIFPGDPPDFFRRIPFGYHDVARIEADLEAAGFTCIQIEAVAMRSRIGSAREAAIGLCQGSPLRAEIEARGSLEAATDAAERAVKQFEGPGGIDAPMLAHVVRATA
ncbi:MAG TPA: class I SAM-dependent methyltransferase [Allosphingosinicella sp.]|nr:class I SAM-dependent methyltransferase [Allosphingosinicella sp.]